MPPTPTPPSFEHSYGRLPGEFFARVQPQPVAGPELFALNRPLAESLGLDPDWLAGPDGVAMLAGNRIPDTAGPLAMAYAGHQFANWVPRLGDGRAMLLGEVVDRDGKRRDLQLKGSGPTPFSRGGDGRSSIGPVVREYLGSEAMHALGIRTTRALAAISTGEKVFRNQPEPGGILCRVASSHVRVGTFEYFARQGRRDEVRTLADYVIDRHWPELGEADARYAAWLERVIEGQADLVASWMLVGFVHGVMNTDNCSIAGETIDYGPFGYVDAFDPGTVYSFIDRRGRYAFNQQPGIAQWNLARLAECVLPLLADEPEQALETANALIAKYPARFESRFHAGLVAKIGLAERREGDVELAMDLLDRMAANKADMTLTFRRLGDLSATDPSEDGPVRDGFEQPEAFDAWAVRWRERLAAEARDDSERRAAMHAINPAFILRNHLAQQAVDAAIERLDFEPMHRLGRVLSRPFDDQPENADLAQPPEPAERVTTTYCGT
ncbi:MAG: YdiU family protein [Wenzhouxiangella sp.]|jgi:uncharacterized protein YdiU (UPF0061 family)|nr:YdiU family protein [Wenzhouxiangella sp.]